MDSRPGRRKILRPHKHRGIGGFPNGYRVHPQQHMHHSTVGSHGDLIDMLPQYACLDTDVSYHVIDGFHHSVLEVFDSVLGMFHFVSDSGEHIQTEMLLGVNHRSSSSPVCISTKAQTTVVVPISIAIPYRISTVSPSSMCITWFPRRTTVARPG